MHRIYLRVLIYVAATSAGCGYGSRTSSRSSSDLASEKTPVSTESDLASEKTPVSTESDLASEKTPVLMAQNNFALPTVANNLVCPAGYISVPEYSDADVGTVLAFCVMKYEAKNVGGVATSQASSPPWMNISRNSARSACSALSDASYTYKLVTNAQWQSMARQIERYAVNGAYVNWSNGSTAGSNYINRGHADNSPSGAQAASTDDNPCVNSNAANCANQTHADFLQKRTHTLPNGQIIWDLAGNASDWVYDDSNFSYRPNEYISRITKYHGDTGPLGKPKAAFGPYGDYSGKSSSPYGGLGYGFISDTSGTVLRGGNYFYGMIDNEGVFAANLGYGPDTDPADPSRDAPVLNGFRCAAVPVP